MPEGYTHIRTARLAARSADLARKLSPAAFCAGANGPDELFCYEAWKPAQRRSPDLPALGRRMHREKTGAFLLSLINHAETPAQKSYTLGFICHYLTDCIVHPYVAMISQKGRLYGMPGGHAYFEIGLDSELHQHDYGSRAVSAGHSNPRLVGTALVQVICLLQVSLREVYGVEVGAEAIGDAFHHAHALRSFFVSSLPLKKGFLYLTEPLFGKRGVITGHLTPAPLKGTRPRDAKRLPTRWRNPYSGQLCEIGVDGLLKEAVRRSVTCLLTCRSYWQGRVPQEQLAALLGSCNYETGLEDPVSRGEAPYEG